MILIFERFMKYRENVRIVNFIDVCQRNFRSVYFRNFQKEVWFCVLRMRERYAG